MHSTAKVTGCNACKSTGSLAPPPLRSSMDSSPEEHRIKLLETHPAHQCLLFIPRKRRFCKFPAMPGLGYCGIHSALSPLTKLKRVPCPFDPRQYALNTSPYEEMSVPRQLFIPAMLMTCSKFTDSRGEAGYQHHLLRCFDWYEAQ